MRQKNAAVLEHFELGYMWTHKEVLRGQAKDSEITLAGRQDDLPMLLICMLASS